MSNAATASTSTASYWQFLGLSRDPFEETHFHAPMEIPQWESQYELMAHLVQYSDVLVGVIGEDGVGKSVFIDNLGQNLQDTAPGHVIVDAQGTFDNVALSDALQALLPASQHAAENLEPAQIAQAIQVNQSHALLMIDNADKLSTEMLVQLFNLVEREETSPCYLHVILTGTNILKARLEKLTQTNQMDKRLHVMELQPLDAEQSKQYVHHCLQSAGLDNTSILSKGDYKKIQKITQGYIGRINSLVPELLTDKLPVGNEVTQVSGQSQLKWWIGAIIFIAMAATVYQVGKRVSDAKEQAIEQPVAIPLATTDTATTTETAANKKPSVEERIVALSKEIKARKLKATTQQPTQTASSKKPNGEAQVSTTRESKATTKPSTASTSSSTTEKKVALSKTDHAIINELGQVTTTPAIEAKRSNISRTPDSKQSIIQPQGVKKLARASMVPTGNQIEIRAKITPNKQEGKTTVAASKQETVSKPKVTAQQAKVSKAKAITAKVSKAKAKTSVAQVKKVTDAKKVERAISSTTVSSNSFFGQEKALLSKSGTSFTIQLLGSHDEKLVKTYISKHQLQGKVYYYRTEHKNKPWYVLVYGNYETSKAAKAAIGSLSSSIAKGKPWVKSLSLIQKAIKTDQATQRNAKPVA